jgi:4-hydroxy-tetrahydrodipicolinate synthase
MRSSLAVGGVYVALLTPFDAAGRVDVDALTTMVDDLIDAGVDGLVALGTTGEFSDLTQGEREVVTAATVAAARGRVPVVVGIGAVGTAEACRHAELAEHAGAGAVLTLPPLFWKLDDVELFGHFAAVAAATSLPVLLYDIPVFTGVRLSPPLVLRIATELPSVVGIKLTVTDFRSVSEVLTAVKPVRPDFSVTVGFEDLALSATLAGADGVISGMANFCAPTLLELVAAARRGDLDAASRSHREVMRLFPVYFQANPPILGLKLLARALGVRIEPRVRTRHDPTAEVLHRVRAWVDSVVTPAEPT